MGNWPSPIINHLPTIHPWSLEAIGPDVLCCNNMCLGNIASATWPLANLAIFIPFTLMSQITVLEMFTMNGATSSSGFDVGVYTSDGTLIVSTASTTQSTTTSVQVCSVSTKLITSFGPGNFYMAMSVNSASATYYRVGPSAAIFSSMFGMATMTAAFPLPTTATLASISTAFIPVIGLSQRSVV